MNKSLVRLTFIKFILNLYTLFIYNKKYILILSIILNIILSIKIFNNFYPFFFYGLVNIFVFIYFKRELKFYLFVYQIYYLVSILTIKIDIAHLTGYSDQFFGYVNPSLFYFNSEYNVIDILFDKIDFEFYQMEILWTKIFYLLRFVSIGDSNVALIFNYSFYFMGISFTYKTLKNKILLFNTEKSFFIFLLFMPPVFFINSLYLKESFITSIIIFLIINLYKKNYLFSLFWYIIFFKIRSSYAVLFILMYFFIRTFYIKKKIYRNILLGFYSIIVLTVFSLAIHFNINNKLFNYFYSASNNTNLRNKTATVVKFIDKENLLSIRNGIVVLSAGVLSPSPTRFLKSRDIVALLESLYVSVFWWIFLSFFIIFILEEKDKRLKIIFLSIFLTVFTASSMSILSPAPEPFRYRLPIYGIFLIGSFLGIYQYNYFVKYKYKSKLKYWFILTAIIYLIYAVI
jgi:hypothetical protein